MQDAISPYVVTRPACHRCSKRRFDFQLRVIASSNGQKEDVMHNREMLQDTTYVKSTCFEFVWGKCLKSEERKGSMTVSEYNSANLKLNNKIRNNQTHIFNKSRWINESDNEANSNKQSLSESSKSQEIDICTCKLSKREQKQIKKNVKRSADLEPDCKCFK